MALLFIGLCLIGTASWRVLKRVAFETQPDALMYSALHLLNAYGSNLRSLARLEIPRLEIAVTVVEGDDESALSVAAGHVPGTAQFGHRGNVIIAGHRDAKFRALRSISIDDRIRVRTDTTYIYVVRRIQVVDRDDVRPLRDTSEPMLTLVTCYPFRYVGNAPKRLIAQARLVGS